jgi:hypothetical protein
MVMDLCRKNRSTAGMGRADYALRMTVIRLQRHAPEARNATRCAVCGTTDAQRVTDHIQVGTPGTPQHDEGVCESCGGVLDNVVGRYGQDLTMMVEEAKREAGDTDITVPGARRGKPDQPK